METVIENLSIETSKLLTIKFIFYNYDIYAVNLNIIKNRSND